MSTAQRATDHEVVSIYRHSDEQLDALLTRAPECVLMWGTRDGWPGLAPEKLFEGRDLAVTTDFRDVFGELLHVHMGTPLASLSDVLPGHDVQLSSFPGLFG